MGNNIKQAAVIGDGGWGTAIGLVLCENGIPVKIWGHDAGYLDRMRAERANPLFLPGIELPAKIEFEPDMEKAVADAGIVVSAIPTKFLRLCLDGKSGIIPQGAPVVSLTKGIEHGTLMRPSEIVAECLGTDKVVALSGPSHAEEVAKKLPSTVVAACPDIKAAETAQAALMTPSFRIYTSTDIVGVELGGALKNVIALAAGICTGLGLGDNAMAALITRGLAEITRLGTKLGCDPMTFAGLSGAGDLVVTCISPFGRNRSVGMELGKGRKLDEILAGMSAVAEGVTTAESAMELGRKAGVELPIIEQAYKVLYENKNPEEAVRELMTREAKPE